MEHSNSLQELREIYSDIQHDFQSFVIFETLNTGHLIPPPHPHFADLVSTSFYFKKTPTKLNF